MFDEFPVCLGENLFFCAILFSFLLVVGGGVVLAKIISKDLGE